MKTNNTFLPTTMEEMSKLGWDSADIILVSGDAYIDSPYNGTALIGRYLESHGFKTAIIAQPDMNSEDIARLGEPKLFWGVSAGCVDSMVANYTASKKPRRTDDFTPGGLNTKRPDRAVIAYTNLIRRHFKNTRPIVIGGIEASLRRVTHYDFWADTLRKSVIFDAKADLLVYGMGESTILKLAQALRDSEGYKDIRGLCYIATEKPKDYIELPSHADCLADKDTFIKMFHTFYKNNDPITAKGLAQLTDSRYLIQNPPAETPSRVEMNSYYELPYLYKVHPYHLKDGVVKAMDTIRNSITTHRGCYGECNFCAIAVHQGTTIAERTEHSIVMEAERYAKAENFNGIINDVGGPTANMYGMECKKKKEHGRCAEKRCLFPVKCPQMPSDHRKLNSVLSSIRNIRGIKRVFTASGIRYDMVMDDKQFGQQYLENLVRFHVGGQLKIAPEHTEDSVLKLMGKPSAESLNLFRNAFEKLNKQHKKKQYLTYYLIAAHPGCTEQDMGKLKKYAAKEMKITPEQVQIFTPTPSTYSSLMYYTEKNPFTGEPLFVEKNSSKRSSQKEVITDRERDRAEAKKTKLNAKLKAQKVVGAKSYTVKTGSSKVAGKGKAAHAAKAGSGRCKTGTCSLVKKKKR